MSFQIRRMLALPLVAFALACGSDSPAGPSGSSQATLKLVNSSANSVLFIRARACGTTSWGPDLLGADILWQGETLTREVAPGCIDVRFTPTEVGADYFYFMGVNAEAGKTTTLTVNAFPAE
jgi:hypothetical protein